LVIVNSAAINMGVQGFVINWVSYLWVYP
jgi:hypothetical protein